VGLLGIVLVVPALAQTTATPLDRDAQEVKSYRLSLSVLQKLDAIHKAAAAARMKDPRYRQLADKKAELARSKRQETDRCRAGAHGRARRGNRAPGAGDDEDAALGNARTLSETGGQRSTRCRRSPPWYAGPA
jgi:hypothetical protein